MTAITEVKAREVLDSRGRPTVEVEVRAGDAWGRAIVPSGASTGTAEALELRDGDPDRYDGLGVQDSVDNVRVEIGPQIRGMDIAGQVEIDRRMIELDGTAHKSRLGANAILGVSLAVAHAAAMDFGWPLYAWINKLQATVPPPELPEPPALDSPLDLQYPAPALPLPMTNMISGGLHAGGNLDFQDVLVMPVGAPDYRTGLEWVVRVYNRLGRLLAERGFEGRLVGDEGGFGPRLKGNRQAIELVVKAIELASLRPGEEMALALDVAASHFFDGTHYRLAAEAGLQLNAGQMIDRLAELVDAFPIRSIEDGLAEDDWDGWAELTRRLGDRVQLVGDDLFTTNPERLARGIRQSAANSILVKVNQIGTLTESLQTSHLARAAGFSRVVSARSGETEDATIADLAVGIAAEQIKIGSIVRSERLAKYNQLLRIAEEF